MLQEGWTALLWTCHVGNKEILNLLLRYKPQLNTPGSELIKISCVNQQFWMSA